MGHLKNNKNSSHSKRNKEDIEKGENEKQKVQETLKMFLTIKFLTIFLYIEKDIFCSKTYFGNLYFIVSENVLYTIRFLVNVFLVLQDI